MDYLRNDLGTAHGRKRSSNCLTWCFTILLRLRANRCVYRVDLKLHSIPSQGTSRGGCCWKDTTCAFTGWHCDETYGGNSCLKRSLLLHDTQSLFSMHSHRQDNAIYQRTTYVSQDDMPEWCYPYCHCKRLLNESWGSSASSKGPKICFTNESLQ